MNRATFLESFGHIAEAPGGVDKLRGLILDLALQGMLVRQEPNDKPASEYLERVREERERHGATKRTSRRRLRMGQLFAASNGPSPSPPGWARSTIGDLFGMQAGKNVPAGTIRESGRYPCYGGNGIRGYVETFNRDGSYPIVGRQGALCGNVQLAEGQFFATEHAVVVEVFAGASVDWAALALAGLHLNQYATATAQPGLSVERISSVPIAVPPLAEQFRIVERAKELTRLCDELEQQQAARAELRSALTASTLNRVIESSSAANLRASVRAFADNIGLHLSPGEGDLVALNRARQAVLDLAVRGRLTHQDPEEQPASDLLLRIAAARATLVKAKTIRKPRDFGPLGEAELGEQLPRGWERARASSFFLASDSGWSPQCLNEPAEAGEWAVLKTSAVSRGVFDANENKKLPSALEPRPQLEVRPGHYVMIRASGSKSLVGRGAIVTETESHLMLSDKHIRLTFVDEASTRYWALLNDSTAVQSYYSAESSGTSTMSNVTRERVGSLVLAVPPLAEQQRIADRVELLLGICAELEQQLVAARGLRHDLSASVSAHAASGPAAP